MHVLDGIQVMGFASHGFHQRQIMRFGYDHAELPQAFDRGFEKSILEIEGRGGHADARDGDRAWQIATGKALR